MRRLSLIAMVVVLAAAGLAAVAWQGPRALDWSHLEPRIRDALGREVSLDGPIRFDLLPRPRLTIAGVSAIDIEVREVRAVLDAAALLAGNLKIETLEFSGAEVTFDRSLLRPLPPLPARRIRIRDSSLAFGNVVVPVETATLTVRGPEGPYRLEARALVDGRAHRVAASVGRWRDHMPVAVSFGDGEFEALAVGAVANDRSSGFMFSGRLAASGESANGWSGTFDAEIRLDADGVKFSDVDAVLADQRFTGAIPGGLAGARGDRRPPLHGTFCARRLAGPVDPACRLRARRKPATCSRCRRREARRPDSAEDQGGVSPRRRRASDGKPGRRVAWRHATQDDRTRA